MSKLTIVAYKFLRDDMHNGSGTEGPWSVGETRRITGRLKLCARGYHSSPSWYDALSYAPGAVAARALISKPTAAASDKWVSHTLQIVAVHNVERELRLWGCDCAERTLNREREAEREPDARSWEAIRVARLFAVGEATREQLDAARVAAWITAWEEARVAARVAAWITAWEEARDAARVAARDAARVAAWTTAGDAARAAARVAAWTPAWATAWDGEVAWQRQRLNSVIEACFAQAPS